MLSRSANRATPAEILQNAPGDPALARELWATSAARTGAIAEAIAYSSALAAAIGGSITWAVGIAMGASQAGFAAALVAVSAFFIYGLDRLRDVDRDGAASPRRSRFVRRHRRTLLLATAMAALGVAGLLLAAPARILLFCLPIGAVGLCHRRLKRGFRWKVGYVACAWTAACVGIPWLLAGDRPGSAHVLWALAFVGPSLVANLIASNLRDGKAVDPGGARDAALVAARGAAIGATALIALAPDAVAPLAWIPAAEALALAGFRASERYGQFAIDGALLVGALLAAGTGG